MKLEDEAVRSRFPPETVRYIDVEGEKLCEDGRRTIVIPSSTVKLEFEAVRGRGLDEEEFLRDNMSPTDSSPFGGISSNAKSEESERPANSAIVSVSSSSVSLRTVSSLVWRTKIHSPPIMMTNPIMYMVALLREAKLENVL